MRLCESSEAMQACNQAQHGRSQVFLPHTNGPWHIGFIIDTSQPVSSQRWWLECRCFSRHSLCIGVLGSSTGLQPPSLDETLQCSHTSPTGRSCSCTAFSPKVSDACKGHHCCMTYANQNQSSCPCMVKSGKASDALTHRCSPPDFPQCRHTPCFLPVLFLMTLFKVAGGALCPPCRWPLPV